MSNHLLSQPEKTEVVPLAGTPRPDSAKDRTILAIKGLAIIGVVFHHLVNRRQDPLTSEWVLHLLMLFHWCVLAFIAVSGYLHAWSDSRRTKGVTEFIFLRFNRLLVPWVALIVFFALIWQTLAALHVSNIGVKIPHDFMSKIAVSLWPVNATVGEQLYYLPILFGASVIFVVVHRLLGLAGAWLLVASTFIWGAVCFYPSEFTGFKLPTFVWSVGYYAAGYLLFHYRAKAGRIRVALLLVTIGMVIGGGYDGVLRSVPLWLIAEGGILRLASIPALVILGEASGTIYIYHTPFIIQPLVIASTYLHGPYLQFIGVLAAHATAIAICTGFYFLLRDTRAKVLLM